jgi:hypothetical protein
VPDEVEAIIGRIDEVSVPRGRVDRCVALAEAVELTPAGGSESGRFRHAVLWQEVRSLVGDIFRAPAVRVGDLRIPGRVRAEVSALLAEVLGKAIAAEVLPARPGDPSGNDGARRFALHHALAERLAALFGQRFRASGPGAASDE